MGESALKSHAKCVGHQQAMKSQANAINIQQFMPVQQPYHSSFDTWDTETITNFQRHKGGNHEGRNIVVT
ncbi:hypothetical protein QQF64_026320 [Cirrhinus molitorella]|uniref:Uncharacterized protein n=1 Tax=Cirrhinus molitorella TaxID=172907 RepID=A0ABR3N948_9TELE